MKRHLFVLAILTISLPILSQVSKYQILFSGSDSGKPEGAIVTRACPGYPDKTTTVEGIATYIPNIKKPKTTLPVGTLCEPTLMESTMDADSARKQGLAVESGEVSFVRVVYFENNQGGSKRFIWVEKSNLKHVAVDCSAYKGESFPLMAHDQWRPEFISAAQQAAKEMGIEIPQKH